MGSLTIQTWTANKGSSYSRNSVTGGGVESGVQDWLSAKGAPNGFDETQLQADLKAIV